jgi:polyhydroxyalkanoate synthesis repressor PhaR
MRIIRRYPNRKIYDFAESRYTNYAEVAKVVRQGEDIQVVDKATGTDLTVQVLALIIAEEAKYSNQIAPDLLYQAIRAVQPAPMP